MNKYLISLILVVMILSCNKVENVRHSLQKLYGVNTVTIDSLDVKKIYASENEIKKMKNLFLMKSLYNENNSLLKYQIEEHKEKIKNDGSINNKLDGYMIELSTNTNEYLKLIAEIDEEIEKLNFKAKNKMDFYLANYYKNRKSEYSVIMDPNFNIIFAQDSVLNRL